MFFVEIFFYRVYLLYLFGKRKKINEKLREE